MSARSAPRMTLASVRALHLPAPLRILLAVLIAFGPAPPAWSAYGTTGRWSEMKDMKTIAVHLALLPGGSAAHSKIVFWRIWDHAPNADTLSGAIWHWNPPGGTDPLCDPTLDNHNVTFANFANEPPFDPFCAANSALSDGRLLVSGGHIAEDIGPRETSIFDPATATWSQSTASMAAGRWYASTVTMPKAGEAMVFGGSRYFSLYTYGGRWNDTPFGARDTMLGRLWLDDGSAWQSPAEIVHAGVPRPKVRHGHTLVTLRKHGMTNLFGGRDSAATPYNDLWSLKTHRYDALDTYEWVPRTPASLTDAPSARSGHTAVVDRNENRMYVFGGLDGADPPSVRNDLRYWEAPGNGKWFNPTIAGPPPARQFHAAIADTINNRNRMLVFGGADASGIPADGYPANARIWSFDMSSHVWTDVSVSGGPAGRQGHSLVHSPVPIDHDPGTLPTEVDYKHRAILYGGRDATSYRNDLWELWIDDSSGDLSWNQVSTGARSQRAFHSAVYDRIWKRMIVIGGETASGTATDSSWALGGLDQLTLNGWTELQSLQGGHGLYHHTAIEGPLIYNHVPERFSAATNTWTALTGIDTYMGWYPFMFLLPSGNVFFAGPEAAQVPRKTKILDMTQNPPVWKATTWNSSNDGGAAVMYRPGEILKTGGVHGQTQSAISERIRFDAGDSPIGSNWQLTGPMAKIRMEHNLTVLPNGEVLVTGGRDEKKPPLSVPKPELYDPVSATWYTGSTLADSPAQRDYHSTAILLPTGAVIVAGGNESPDADKSNIYCPPYLFKPGSDFAAPRPVISPSPGPPTSVFWGDTFTVCVPDTIGIRGACLIRSGATTHAFDQNQRFVPLNFTLPTSGPQRLFVTSPADSNVAPPGYYLLFLTGSHEGATIYPNVPSIAKWVRLGRPYGRDTCDVTTGTTITDLTPDITTSTSVAMTWTATADDASLSASGRSERFHMRRAASYIDTEAEWDIAQVVGALPTPADPGYLHDFTVQSLQPCTIYHFTLRAEDDNANKTGFPEDVIVGTLCGGGGGGGYSAREVEGSEEGGGPAATAVGSGAAAREVAALTSGLGSPTGTLIAETRRLADGSWRAYLRLATESDGLDPTASAISIEREATNGGRETLGRFTPTDAEPLLGLSSLRDRGRVVIPGFSGLEQVMPRVRIGGQDYALTVAQHSRLGALGTQSGAGVLGPELIAGDILDLTYTPSRDPQADATSSWVHVRRQGTAPSVPFSQRRDPAALLPAGFALHQSEPNPAGNRTKIRFELPVDSPVRLEVFDLLGRKVATVAETRYPAGYHAAEWDLRDMNGGRARPGVYIYRMTAGDFRAKQKLSVLP